MSHGDDLGVIDPEGPKDFFLPLQQDLRHICRNMVIWPENKEERLLSLRLLQRYLTYSKVVPAYSRGNVETLGPTKLRYLRYLSLRFSVPSNTLRIRTLIQDTSSYGLKVSMFSIVGILLVWS